MCGIWNLGQSTAAQLSHYRCLYRVWQGIGRQEPAARIFHLSATALSDVIMFSVLTLMLWRALRERRARRMQDEERPGFPRQTSESISAWNPEVARCNSALGGWANADLDIH